MYQFAVKLYTVNETMVFLKKVHCRNAIYIEITRVLNIAVISMTKKPTRLLDEEPTSLQ